MAKIAIISGDFPPNARGTGFSAYNISKFLHEKYQHQIIVLCRQGKQSDTINVKNDIFKPFITKDIVELRSIGKIYRQSIPKIPLVQILVHRIKMKKIIVQEKPDIIVVVTPGIYSIPNIKTIPYIIKNGGNIFIYNYYRKLDSAYSLYIKVFGKILFFLEKILFKRAKKVISVSHFESSILYKYYKLKKKKLTSVRNGILYIQEQPNILKRDKIQEILFVGQLNQIKGIKNLLIAFLDVLQVYPNLHLNIIGNGHLLNDLKTIVVNSKAQKNIRFQGYLPKNKISEHYEKSDLVIVPSLHDACPNVVLEAFGHGIPVLGSKTGGIPELIEHNVTGLIFAPNSPSDIAKSIKFMVQNDEKYEEMKREIIKRQHSYSWNKRIDKFEAIIQKVLKNKK